MHMQETTAIKCQSYAILTPLQQGVMRHHGSLNIALYLCFAGVLLLAGAP